MNQAPRAGTFDKLGELEQTITCGSVVINPGDIIVGDINGVVVVPSELAEQVADAAMVIQEREKQIKELLLQGNSLEDAAEKLSH